MLASVALKYARALLEVAAEAGLEDNVMAELDEFRGLLGHHAELSEALLNPAIPFLAKRKIIEAVAEKAGWQKTTLNFLLVVQENNRIDSFEDILQACRKVMDERKGILRGEVVSVSPISDSMRTRLQEKMSRMTGKTVMLEGKIDRSLIGGVKVQLGSQIFDGSVRTQLETIQRKLVG